MSGQKTGRRRAGFVGGLTFFVGLMTVLPSPMRAQFEGFGPSDVPFASLVVERPVHPASFDVSTIIAHAAYGHPVRPRITLVGGLSLVQAREAQRPTSTVLSNAWLEFHFGRDKSFGTLTLTLPLARRIANEEAYAADAGIAADVERPERYTDGTTGVAFRLNPRWSVGASGTVGGRIGLAAVAPASVDPEFYARFAGFGETEVRAVRMGAELTGAWSLNPRTFTALPDPTFGERSTSYGTLFVGLPGVTLAPNVFVRVPLDADARRRLRAVIGVKLRY